ncbi:dTDP-4-dehydrorhamnose reductase [Octadecabacter sp. 1_MG-2023]|uniref:dTDP-4-dehydrorhamnose reductase n=1 Tax=unclassified Octadecabacter TaxID=196158 RepID=UPI001C095C2C|nr:MULTISPECIES: dTDP-4-dehydrorhamnose reductase [unclassified Octadecabacter]MBU2994000.1 dTDP-4-dehydrorhamnose reductase [Octadecabacter sp. B2R22]MDO6736057.1 dTDP-4-dehydrorhamnose reductase [Octadecabacter sp. 1_MG-2023]
MTWLVFGENGQVAQELGAILGADCVLLGRSRVDLLKAGQASAAIETALSQGSVDGIINAAAYTAVDAAETDRDAAFALNATAPGEMAQSAAAAGIPFVHLSTDYVFDGSGTAPWHPDDATGPASVYGASKLAGENAVRGAGGLFAILRTSWVFSAHGANFVKTMRRLGAERDELSIVADQIGGPTPAGAIAQACITVAKELRKNNEKSGIYHISGAPDCSWADFARAIFSASDLTVSVHDIPTTAYPTPAMRPANSRLDCTSLEHVFGIARPDWRAELDRVLQDLD